MSRTGTFLFQILQLNVNRMERRCSEMEEKEQLLKETIQRTQKTIETQAGVLFSNYDKQINLLLENKQLLEQFKKATKDYDSLQFYLNEVTQPDLLTITAKYAGIDIATIIITKDKTTISTETQEESNKEQFKCDIQLKDEDLKSIQAKRFLEFFKQDFKLKTKPNKENQEAMLLAEFSKTSSYDKILTGIQPIKYSTLYYPIPIMMNQKKMEYINILARTKVRKITIIEVMSEDQELESILTQATAKATMLLNILSRDNGDRWYKIFGFHGAKPSHLTIKVCIAVPKSSKIKEFEPFTIQSENGVLDYRYLQFDADAEKVTAIISNVND